MVIIKRRQLKGYILLESLIALAVLSILTVLLLDAFTQTQRRLKESQHHQEALLVATMAIKNHQSDLIQNGIHITVKRDKHSVRVYEKGKDILHVVQK